MEGFFLESLSRQIYNTMELRDCLYDLMAFIDKRSHKVNDGRLEGRLIFSYCSEFDHALVAPLMEEYLRLKEARLESAEVGDLEKEATCRQIDYISHYIVWLKNSRVFDFSKEVRLAKEGWHHEEGQPLMVYDCSGGEEAVMKLESKD